MEMQLIDDFKTKYPRYWSVWLNFGAGLLSVLELCDRFGLLLPAFEGAVPPGTYVALSIGLTLAGLFARAIKQSSLNPEAGEAQ
jgi:hypothetical protein